MGTKIPVQKSKEVVVVYFGSDDLFDLLSDQEYNALHKKLTDFRPADISAMPVLMAGTKTVRVSAKTEVLKDGEKWAFVPVPKSKRAQEDPIHTSPYLAKAAEQLNTALTGGKPGFVLLPYYYRFQKI